MYKKMILGGLGLLFILSLAFQASPALALGDDPPPPPESVPVKITGVKLLEGYPPRLRITGILPADCYRATWGASLGKPLPNISILPLNVRVKGVQMASRKVCSRTAKPFAITVTLDPLRLPLKPGRYLVLVNPVNGWSRFPVLLKIPRVIPVY